MSIPPPPPSDPDGPADPAGGAPGSTGEPGPPPANPYGGGQYPGGQYGGGQYGGGQAPPPPGPPGYIPAGGLAGGPGGAPTAYSPGSAFTYGWLKFQQNVGPIILATLAILVGVAIIEVLSFVITGGISAAGGSRSGYDSNGNYTYDSGNRVLGLLALLVSLLFALVSAALGFLVQAAIIRGALDITYGRQVTVRSMTQGLNLVQVVIASVLLAIATTIGFVLCIIPGFVVMFFTIYTLYFVVDKDMPALEAIPASIRMVNRNLGTLIGFFLAAVLAYVVGALLCLVGLLVAIPVIVIAQAYTYRTLQGESVAA